MLSDILIEVIIRCSMSAGVRRMPRHAYKMLWYSHAIQCLACHCLDSHINLITLTRSLTSPTAKNRRQVSNLEMLAGTRGRVVYHVLVGLGAPHVPASIFTYDVLITDRAQFVSLGPQRLCSSESKDIKARAEDLLHNINGGHVVQKCRKGCLCPGNSIFLLPGLNASRNLGQREAGSIKRIMWDKYLRYPIELPH